MRGLVADHRGSSRRDSRRELALPTERTGTVAAIGRRWGFADATNFGRAFRQAYGMSPRDWRERRN